MSYCSSMWTLKSPSMMEWLGVERKTRSQVLKCIINKVRGNNLKEHRFLKRVEEQQSGSSNGEPGVPIPILTWCYKGCGRINIPQMKSVIPCKGIVSENEVEGFKRLGRSRRLNQSGKEVYTL